MSLNTFAAETRLRIFEELRAGRDPSGEVDRALLEQGRDLGEPQLGATIFSPDALVHEFIFSEKGTSQTVVVTVKVRPPERIVFMPVPPWVVESIWQGEISGSPHFESDALRMLEEFRRCLEPGENERHFADRDRVGRG